MEIKKVLVVFNFAQLTGEQYAHVISEVRKKYPEHRIIPKVDEKEKDFEEQSKKVKYVYFVCYLEESLKNEVKLTYQSQQRKINRIGCYISLKGV